MIPLLGLLFQFNFELTLLGLITLVLIILAVLVVNAIQRSNSPGSDVLVQQSCCLFAIVALAVCAYIYEGYSVNLTMQSQKLVHLL